MEILANDARNGESTSMIRKLGPHWGFEDTYTPRN